MNPSTNETRLTPAESSKLLKRELREAFPGTTFSMRLSRGTGYGSVNVRWADGPSYREVERVAGRWEGKSFDGMTDSTSYHRRQVGTAKDGTPLISGLGYVLLNHDMSEAYRAAQKEVR
jgi:hypothetical protein